MTVSEALMDQPAAYSEADYREWDQSWMEERVNVGDTERAVSLAAGAILAILGLARGGGPGLLTAAVGGALVYRGTTGRCPAYSAVGMDTAHTAQEQEVRDIRKIQRRVEERGIHVEEAFLINRTAQELYDYWRSFENLPTIMTHLESVQVLDDRRSRWTAKAPRIAGGTIEWEAEITADEPGRRIAWRSMPGSDIDTAGEIRFSPGLGDRGTEVHVFMRYIPPAGRLGHWIATLVGHNPESVVRQDLRSFKRLMETGEIPTTEGQPTGACTGNPR